MANLTREQVDQYLQNENLRKFLNLISYLEGTSTFSNPYLAAGGTRGVLLDTGYGGHPAQFGKGTWEFTQTDGTKNRSTANGKYQILHSTWQDAQRALQLPDFSPQSQDAAAVYLINRRNALNDILSGSFDAAVQKLSKEWASFPSAPPEYKQNKASWDKVRQGLASVGADLTVQPVTTAQRNAPIVASQGASVKKAPAPNYAAALQALYRGDIQVTEPTIENALAEPSNFNVQRWLVESDGPWGWTVSR